jgi:hypothetical protein
VGAGAAGNATLAAALAPGAALVAACAETVARRGANVDSIYDAGRLAASALAGAALCHRWLTGAEAALSEAECVWWGLLC